MEWDHFDGCVLELSGQLFSMQDIGQFGLAVGTEIPEWVCSLEVQIGPGKKNFYDNFRILITK